MYKYPIWKYIVIAFAIAIGVVYSLPNAYPEDPAIQVAAISSDTLMTEQLMNDIKNKLLTSDIIVKDIQLSLDSKSVLVRLNSNEDQLRAQGILRRNFSDGFVVALNKAQTTPDWLLKFGAKPMSLGLDLSGGVHFLLEVDMDKALEVRQNVYEGEIKTILRRERIRHRSLPRQNSVVRISFDDEENLQKARSLLYAQFPEFLIEQVSDGSLEILNFSLLDAKKTEIRDYAINQNLVTVRNRVNELGVSEPLVQRSGANRIVVELPGVQDTAEAKRILGKTANLEFRLQAGSDTRGDIFEFSTGGSAALERDVIITGDQVTDAQAGFDERGRPMVSIRLDGRGGDIMNKVTRGAVGRAMGIVFIESRPVIKYVSENIDGNDVETTETSFEESKKIISLATIQSALSSQFQITGLGQGESSELALLLRAGGLAAPMHFVSERTIGPSLGVENITKGIQSTIWALCFVAAFMIAIYKVFGIFATVSLLVNLILLVAVMSVLGATLTLPGIAGIVLTLGMAVDANVLIFSRIKEEIAKGMPMRRAIDEGFDKAYSAIIDSNLTSLLVGMVLFALGTGAIKGFAVTLSVGILTSLFTATMVTRSIIALFMGNRELKQLWI